MTDLAYVHSTSLQPFSGRTIDDHFRRIVTEQADREALVVARTERSCGLRWTYSKFDAEIDRVARGLLGWGVAAGDRVGVWATNHAEWVMLQMATARIGAIFVTINPAYREKELAHALRLARVQVLVTMPGFRGLDYVASIANLVPEIARHGPMSWTSKSLPELRGVVVFDAMRDDAARPSSGWNTWAELLDAGEDVDDEATMQAAENLDPDDPVNIQFTSGTTGASKAVLLTHRNLLENGLMAAASLRFGPGDRLCVSVPFYHCFGMVVANLGCWSVGATVVLPSEAFDAVATVKTLIEERCTAVHGVPTMFLAELEELRTTGRTSADLPALRTGIMAGAPCPPELVRRVIDEMGCPELLVGYGQTECSPAITFTRPDDSLERRTQTVGVVLPHEELKIVDPATGRTLQRDEEGEVCVRGYNVMRGYYGDEAATRRAIDDAGWLHTGDLGRLDDDDYLAVTGRLCDMIIRGGENVYPAEVEAFYYEHPDVTEIAVFGVADERLGEEVAAWIKRRPGASDDVDAEALREHGRRHLSRFKVPRRIRFVDEFPMTVTGKIQKFRMREAEEASTLRNDHHPGRCR